MANSTTSDPAGPSYSPEFLAEYSGSSLIATATVFIILDLIFVALRFIARRMSKAAFGGDDALMIAGLLCALTINTLGIVEVAYAGVGYHTPRVLAEDPNKLVLWSKLIISEILLYIIGVALPKLAMIFLFLRIFTGKAYRVACYILAGIMILTVIIVSFLGGFSCVPIAFFWDKTIPGGHCLDQHTFFAWASLPNVITDVAMLLLPMPTVWHLQISRALKVGLTFTFLTGSIGLAASIARFTAFLQRDPVDDPTWVSVELMIWTIVEVSLYLIAACLPTLRPLAVLIWKHGNQTLYGKQSVQDSTLNRSVQGKPVINGHINKTISVTVSGEHLMRHDGQYLELVESGRVYQEKQRPFKSRYAKY